VVKSTSENALPNRKKKTDQLPRRSRETAVEKRRARAGKSAGGTAVRAVFLVGFMGAGKSSVGRALARVLNWVFEDLDDRIERSEGRTVAEIFRDSGEREFRRAEYHALRQLLDELRGGSVKVVALGGGAFVQDDNAVLLHDSAVPSVFLDAPVEELWQRCRQQAGTERPLLKSQEQFRRLYVARKKGYAKASVRIETGGRTIDEVASEIARKLGLKKIGIRTEQGEVE